MLKVLLVEDCPQDAELVEAQIRKEGLKCRIVRVETKADFCAALDAGSWDLILTDFVLPLFGALQVLEIVGKRGLGLPIILLTGAVPEERAVEFLTKGGTDFLLKGSLKRLGSSMKGALERLAAQRQARLAESALRESQERLRLMIDGARDYAMFMLDRDGTILTWNSGAERIFGRGAIEVLGAHFSKLYGCGKGPQATPAIDLAQALVKGHVESEGWLPGVGKVHAYVNVLITALYDSNLQLRGFSHVARNITDKHQAEAALKTSNAQLKALTAKLQSLREAETVKIAREIHDELGQALTAIKIELSRIAEKLDAKGEPLASRLHESVDLTNATIQSVQRIVMELRPRLLDELGLQEAIRWQLKEFRKRTGIRCRLTNRTAAAALPSSLATTLYRIFQESLTNIARHAKATAVYVRLGASSTTLTLVVRDNGRGIQTTDLEGISSLGLLGMRERAELAGGQFRIRPLSGTGTEVTVTLPLEEQRSQLAV